jgi:hypothetical protein
LEPVAKNDGIAEVRIELENGSYARLAEGIVHLYLADNTELFSVDANTVLFEKKTLVAMMQIFLIGVQRGRSTELANIRQKLSQIINLVFN